MSLPSGPADDNLTRLQQDVDYCFGNRALLGQALVHASYRGSADSNERLEFLGDRVLGLAIAHLLHERYPTEAVGSVARRHAALVRREALSEVARRIGLPKLLRMSRGEEETGGRDNPGLLADACEALIAAIYLDGGLDAALLFVRRQWQSMIEGHVTAPKDAKTALQEWVQGRGLPPPVYREVGRDGPAHGPTFVVEVVVPNIPPVRGSGASKRVAEQAAAERALSFLQDTGALQDSGAAPS
ncbi:MAG TPA: ribonuclease III [Candidatus Defluviicoccus seviourii]|nr:ribonuclease III [Candidatus Defluviicoccus seviourii]